MPNWTPGPWAATAERIVSEYHEPFGIVSPAPRYGAEDICGTFHEQADATLAAAAPELYEALEMLVNAVDDAEGVECRALVAFVELDVCRAALAKARGEK